MLIIKGILTNPRQAIPHQHHDIFKVLNATRVYSHSYWLTIFCTTNSSPVLSNERPQNIENSWEKNTIFNEHSLYLPSSIPSHILPPQLKSICPVTSAALFKQRLYKCPLLLYAIDPLVLR